MAFPFSQGFHPQDVINIIRRRLWWGIIIFIGIVGSTAYWTSRQVPIYTASNKIMISPDIPQILFSDAMLASASLYYESLTFDTQLYTLKSRPVTERVVLALGLADREVDVPAFESAVRRIQGAISITQIPRTRLYRLMGTSTEPEMARDIANTTAEVYIQQTLERKVNASQRSIKWLTGQIIDIKDRIKQSEENLLRYQEDQGFLKTGYQIEGGDVETLKNAGLNSVMTEAKLENIDLKMKIENLKKLMAMNDFIPASMLIKDAGSGLLTNLHHQIMQSEIDLSRLLQKYKDKHPKVLQLRKEVDLLKEKYHGEMARIIQAMEHNQMNLEAKQQVLKDALSNSDHALMEANKKRISFEILKREADSNKEVYNLLMRKLKETDIARGGVESNIEIIEYATTPKVPVSPNIRKIMMFAMIIGLSMGIGFIFLLEYFDRTLKSVEEIKSYLTLPIIALIPSIQRDEARPKDFMMYSENHSSNEAEAFRALRTNIKFCLAEKQDKTLLITSSSPKEGKTTIVSNLGITLAMSMSTVIIDTDFRKPQLHSIFGIDSGLPGISDYLVGENTIDEVIYRTEKEGLNVIPCGTIPPNPTELLDSSKMKATIEMLKGRYDLSIYDSPPIGLLTDGVILSTLLGGVLIVLNTKKVNKLQAKKTKDILQSVKAHIHGIVVNDYELAKSGTYYDYYYYYSGGQYGGVYGNDGESGDEAPRRRRRKRKKNKIGEGTEKQV